MNPARALRNDTTPPPEAILRMYIQDLGADLLTADNTEAPDWGKVETYLPQGSSAYATAIEDGTSLYSFSSRSAWSFANVAWPTMESLTSLSCLTPLSSLSLTRNAAATLYPYKPLLGRCFDIPPLEPIVILLDEARKTTEAGILSFVYDRLHADIKAANVLDILRHGIIADTTTTDPLEGYEQYQTADWDGHGAEAITAGTLAYARRLMEVMPPNFGLPDVAPAADGTIALEWVVEDATHILDKLFLDIGPGEVWRAYWKLRSGEFGRLPQTGFSDATVTILKKLFNDLSA